MIFFFSESRSSLSSKKGCPRQTAFYVLVESVQNIMPGEYMQTIKVALVLAGCSFIGGVC